MTTARRSMLKAVAAAPLAWSQEHQAAAAQHPSAIILSCADSRVPPEVLLDQDIGDLFTVRVAIEYAVERFGCPLCVVLGHDECGAVAAVVNLDKVPESIQHLVKHISETVEKTGALKIAGAVYHLTDGRVSWLGTYPEAVSTTTNATHHAGGRR
ncbi:MAG TPA: carbonic anhydrase [Bryobacteraceae bacterium]|nr:carbonic anhydrase [Bryobacteraceae bacterium]